MRTKVSAVIIAFNEETHLVACLESLYWVDEIIVVDSGSTDSTLNIAARHGARVIQQAWTGWSTQRTIGIASASHDWILVVDADEAVSPRLAEAIMNVLSTDLSPNQAFAVDRRGDFLGLLLPNSQTKRRVRNFTRLFNRTTAAYPDNNEVHELVTSPNPPSLLPGVLYHWRGASVRDYAAMNIRYASIEAESAVVARQNFTRTRLILMPVLRFTYLFFIKQEFRLGVRGYLHAVHRAHGDLLRYAIKFEQTNGPYPKSVPPDLLSQGLGQRPQQDPKA